MGFITDRSIERLKAIYSQAKFEAVANTDEQALEVQALYPDWEDLPDGTVLEEWERVNYKDSLYKVLSTHEKQALYNPVDANYLFSRVLIPDATVIPEWIQPDYTNAYMTGDKVTHNGKTWESLIDNNSWEPGAAGTESLWKEIVA